MTGKEKCELLKSIRKRIAEMNGIPYDPKPCTHGDDCFGVCPLCEHEANYLMKELKKKEEAGSPIRIDTESVLSFENLASSSLGFDDEEILMGLPEPLEGDVIAPEFEEEEDCKEKAIDFVDMMAAAKSNKDVLTRLGIKPEEVRYHYDELHDECLRLIIEDINTLGKHLPPELAGIPYEVIIAIGERNGINELAFLNIGNESTNVSMDTYMNKWIDYVWGYVDSYELGELDYSIYQYYQKLYDKDTTQEYLKKDPELVSKIKKVFYK